MSKISTVLNSLSRAELSKLDKYLVYRSDSKDMHRLFARIQEMYPNCSLEKADRAKITKELFKGKPRTIDNLKGRLKNYILDFLVAQQCESIPSKAHSRQYHSKEYYFVLLEEYQKRELDDAFFKLVDKLEKEWDLTLKEDVGIEHMQCITRLWTMKINHHSYEICYKNITQSFKNIFVTLDQYYFASKLYWTLVKDNNERVVGPSEDFQTYPEDRIIEYININSEKFGPQNSLLAKISGIYYKNDVKEILDLKTEVLEKLSYFNDTEKKGLFQFLIDIHKNNYKAGALESAHTLFELYKYGLEDGLLWNGQFAFDVFLSIVHVTSAVNEIKWTKQFVIDYNDKIIPEYREDTIRLANATIALNEEDCEKVLEELMFVNNTDLVFNLRTRFLRLLAFFQLKENGPFVDGANAFKAFINSKLKNGKISEGIHEEIKTFISFLKKIHNCRNKIETKKNDYEKIKSEIEKHTKVSGKIWLLKIINKLIDSEKK